MRSAVLAAYSICQPVCVCFFQAEDGIRYLAVTGVQTCALPIWAVFERYQAWERELEREPVDFIARRLGPLLEDARAELGSFVGARGDDLTFVQNATTGVNMAARALDLRPGDEVLTTNLEYGACVLTWQRLCTLVQASFDELFEHVTERTKAVFVSHIT